MTVIAQEALPLGFRFHPTDEELVNHYLKRKITGRIKSEVEVIPEVDVCKCEPWDLPDKSLIRSDDPEWFFFGPRDRKYPNGHRCNRATVAGYWKATGKDRFIRSKASLGKPTVIGMKKTLVFHRGRAPKGLRTSWIMHEYRTTEPEFESGEEGGFVLYRLFKKPEETIPNSNADEMDRSGFSPTPTKSSPGDTQHDADAMEELATPSNSVQESPISDAQETQQLLPDLVDKQPAGIKRWLADKADCTSTCSVKPDEGFCNLTSKDHQDAARANVQPDNLQDVLGQICDPQYEQKGADGFANISTPMLPYTDHSFFGHNNKEAHMGFFPVDNADQDSLNEFLNSVLSNPDEYYSGASYAQKDLVDETVPRRSIWDSASCKDSATSSDIDTETGIMQEPIGLEGSECLYGSPFLSINSLELEMDTSNGYPEVKPHLSALYENVSLLPYDNTGPDVYSVDSSTKSLQDLFDSMEESTSQKNMMMNNGDRLEGTGIRIMPRQQRHTPISIGSHARQGTATRRILLEIPKVSSSSDESVSSCNKNGPDDKEATSKDLLDSSDSMAESANLKNITSDRDGLVGTGIKIRTRRAQCSPVSNNLPAQGTAVRRIRLENKLEVGSNATMDHQSSSNKDGNGEKLASSEAGEHSEFDTADESEISGPAHLGKIEDLCTHGDETSAPKVMPKPSEEAHQESELTVRLRRKGTDDIGNTLEVPPLKTSSRRIDSSPGSIMLLILPVILLALCVGIWRWMNLQDV